MTSTTTTGEPRSDARREAGTDAGTGTMRAVTWQGVRSLAVEEVPVPALLDEGDAIVDITTSAICGSDLHLYELMAPFLSPGQILGHEAVGVVREVGAGVSAFAPGDRVVIAAQVACGQCWMCRRGLHSQCETTQNREHGTAASVFGYSELYGAVPGLQAERARVPFADVVLLPITDDQPDEHWLTFGDILPTAWQGVEYADVGSGDTVVVFGLGPVGQLVTRVARHRGAEVYAVDPVAERRAMAERHGIPTYSPDDFHGGELVAELRRRTLGRGPDAVIDAVGIEADGNPGVAAMQRSAAKLPKSAGQHAFTEFGMDRLSILHDAVDLVRRGGTISLTGVYAGNADVLPMMTIWDKQLTLRGGMVNAPAWQHALRPLLEDRADPLGLDDLVTHRVPLEDAPAMYETFQKKEDGCIKVLLRVAAAG